jgi:FG-GAP-like repeat
MAAIALGLASGAPAALPGAGLITQLAGVPGNIAVADLTGDGRPDVIVPDFGSDLVSIRLNEGGDRFGPVKRYAVGLKPSFIAVGDFNRDGRPDIAVSNAGSGDVSVLINRGNGTFAPAGNLAVSRPGGLSGGSFSVQAIDVNHDGLLDLVTSNSLTNDVSVLLGRGNGTFSPAHTYAIAGPNSIGLLPFALSAGDLTGAGFPDLVTGGINSVTVMRNDGFGGFTAEQSYPVGLDVACTQLGDFNGDGHPDIVATGTGTLNAQILLNNGNGTFRPGQDLLTGGIGPQCASVADFARNGEQDLAIANSSSTAGRGDVGIFLGHGNGTFSAGQQIAVGIAPWATAVADLNRDHIPDLVVCNTLPESFSLLLGRGNGTFVTAGTFGM